MPARHKKSGLRVKAVKGRFGSGGRPQIDSLEALVGSYLAGPCMALRALGSSPPHPHQQGCRKEANQKSQLTRDLVDSTETSGDDAFTLTGSLFGNVPTERLENWKFNLLPSLPTCVAIRLRGSPPFLTQQILQLPKFPTSKPDCCKLFRNNNMFCSCETITEWTVERRK